MGPGAPPHRSKGMAVRCEAPTRLWRRGEPSAVILLYRNSSIPTGPTMATPLPATVPTAVPWDRQIMTSNRARLTVQGAPGSNRQATRTSPVLAPTKRQRTSTTHDTDGVADDAHEDASNGTRTGHKVDDESRVADIAATGMADATEPAETAAELDLLQGAVTDAPANPAKYLRSIAARQRRHKKRNSRRREDKILRRRQQQ